MSNHDEEQNESSAPLEIMEASGAIAAIEKASIDQQVATAHQFPRSIKTFMADAKDMVLLDLDTAEGCYYRLERKDRNAPGGVKIIEGPSVRLLEIAASCYGNIRYGSRVIAIEDKFVVTQGVAHDLQKNVYSSSETRRRITTKAGIRFGDDMIAMTANAACSISKRNALNGVIPRVYVNQLCEMAKAAARGDAQTLSARRTRAVDFFVTKLGVKLEKLLAKLDRKGVEEITLEDVERLNGIKTAIKEGDTTIDEEFDPKPEASATSLSDVLGNKADPKPEAKQEAPKQEQPATKTEKTYTAEERAAILKEVEDAMISCQCGESKVLAYLKPLGKVRDGQDEVGALDSTVLDELRGLIPQIKKGAAK